MTARLLVVVVLAVSSRVNASPAPTAPAPDVQPAQPVQAQDDPISGGRWWASLPLATTMGLVGFAGGALFGYIVLQCADEGTGCATGVDNSEAITAVAVGGLGASLGAYLGGRRRDSTGDLRKSLLITAIPTAIAMVAVSLADDSNNEDVLSVVGVASLISLPIVSTISDGYFRKRRAGIHERIDHDPGVIERISHPRLSFDVPVSTNLGLSAGYCHPVGDELAACGRAGYRIEESTFVDYDDNRHAVHVAGGLRYLPNEIVRLDVGAIGLTTRRDDATSRSYHAGGYTSLLLGYRRIFVGPELRLLGRFDDLTQVMFVGRYELLL